MRNIINPGPLLLISLLLWLVHSSLLAQTGAPESESEPVSAGASAGHSGDTAAEPEVADPESSPSEASDSAETDDAEQQASFEARLDALLAEGEAEEAYGETENCLYRRQFQDIDIINDRMLLFSRGNQYWLNTLKHECLGLRRDMVINLVFRGVSSLCRNDQVYANRRFDIDQGLTASGRPMVVRAVCILGEFRPVAPSFAESLKALR